MRADDPRPEPPADHRATDEAPSAASQLFDLRTVIAILFIFYGVILTIMGLISGFTWWSMLYRPGTTDRRRAGRAARSQAGRFGRAGGHLEPGPAPEATRADPGRGHARPEPRT